MSEKNKDVYTEDLTRWNRAGLKRFRYVDGNAVTWLEFLRRQLVSEFKNPETQLCEWLAPAEETPQNELPLLGESIGQQQERLSRIQQRSLEMYHQPRRDWAWEISRSFARACHILTEHCDAYANESQLSTATQWEHVRRLVAMLDYQPAPPASAYTPLVFIAKDKAAGLVPEGFQIKYSAKDSNEKIIFETLQELFIDAELNHLRPQGWNKSASPIIPGELTETLQPYPQLAMAPLINLEAVDANTAKLLNAQGKYLIKDLLELERGTLAGKFNEDNFRKIKANALAICRYQLAPIWLSMGAYSLPEVVDTKPSILAEKSGRSLAEVKRLQLDVLLLSTYLKPNYYNSVKLNMLYLAAAGAPPISASSCIITPWLEPSKPRVSTGQVAMVLYQDAGEDIAEATRVCGIDKNSNAIKLSPSRVNYTWLGWPRGQTRLLVVPRWKRSCWLNGSNVIRTVSAHGFTPGAYISWQEPSTESTSWRYAKVLQADTRSMRLEIEGELPRPGTELLAPNIIDGDKLSADLQEIILIDEAAENLQPNGDRIKAVTPQSNSPSHPTNKPNPLFKIKKIFSIQNEGGGSGSPPKGGGGGLLPPATLPEIGSFLFPSPMLPMDLVKVALDLLLSLGVMQIPSTGEFVIKGMPFGEMVDSANDLDSAAEALVSMLDELQMSAKWFNNKLVQATQEISSASFDDDDKKVTLNKSFTPIYFELLCDEDGQVPSWAKGVDLLLINKIGDEIKLEDREGLKCLNGLVVDAEGYPVGYQPVIGLEEDNFPEEPRSPETKPGDEDANGRQSKSDGGNDDNTPKINVVPVQFKLTDWATKKIDIGSPGDEVKEVELSQSEKIERMKELLNSASQDASILFKLIDKTLYDADGNPRLDHSTNQALQATGPLLAVAKNPQERIVKAVVDAIDPFVYYFNGDAETLYEKLWVAGDFTDGLRALKIEAMTRVGEDDGTFALTFSNLQGDEGELIEVYSDFRGELKPQDAAINREPINSKTIQLETLPANLNVGRELLLSPPGKAPMAATLTDINRENGSITINPPAAGFVKGELIIHGNVVIAGHGETQGEKIIGSGNGAKTNQEFVIKAANIAFIQDATKRSGVAADLSINVAGQIWQQVSSLKDSTPSDGHYTVRMTEEGFVKVIFGDGVNGRRLPTGKNNIRARYRLGSGTVGNVPTASLHQPVKPHPLLASVIQPLPAQGGGDMEDIQSLRENAPPSLLALERAVSVSDFTHLAMAHSSVWQARAYREHSPGLREEQVKVVIIPAGGDLGESAMVSESASSITEVVARYLQNHALPSVKVVVSYFIPKHFQLSINIFVNTASFLGLEVVNQVRSQLAEQFSLKNRKLGENLYISDVYKVVEAIKGVENSTCVLDQDPAKRLIEATDQATVVYLQPGAASLQVNFSEYQR